MERIVLGISAINFNSSSDILTEKPVTPNAALEDCWDSTNQSFTLRMAASAAGVIADNEDDDRFDEPSYSFSSGHSSDQNDVESTPPRYRRSLPPRTAKSKENTSLLRIKRRSIMKPRRNLNFDIRKIYLDNKVKGNFRPSNLETIFEEPTPDKNKQLCFIGAKKIKRSLSCSDGLNITKTTVKSRRNKIKKTFGKRFALKKISLDDFIDRLNASFDDKLPDAPQSVPPSPSTTNQEAKTDDSLPEKLNEADENMECIDETLLAT